MTASELSRIDQRKVAKKDMARIQKRIEELYPKR
jgi:hypothetical protein